VAGTERERPRPAGDWPPGLPVPLTRFVGREHERAEVARLVAANRLVTLVGAGGVGKTRLAVEVAASVAADFDDGAVLIELSAVTDAALLPGAVARVLGVEERAGTGLDDRLVRVLRGQHRLLVVDNCEHLRGPCADLVTALLGSCPDVVVLATSRESLGVPGEVTWRVPSLTFPWPEDPPAAADMENFEAIALFLARARAARPGLVTGPGEVGAVTSICFHLDGIPLALELAAARAGALDLEEIAERLSGRFELLARSGTGPARHQTLRASVEWSHQLLSEPERAVFRRLAVFVGGWPLEAAEAVCALPPIGRGEVTGLLAALVDKSLVHVDHTSAGSRFRLLEVIRAFASERLAESGELAEVRERHGSYYAELAERSESMLRGPDQTAWAARLDQETGNLRAARRWCAEDQARADTGLRLAAGLYQWCGIRGLLAEGAVWLEDALALDCGPARARAMALYGLGLIVSFRGEPARARDLFVRSIECSRRCGWQEGEVHALVHLGPVRALCGDAAGAAEACDRALALTRRVGDPWLEACALFRSAFTAGLYGDVVRARALATASVALSPSTGDRRLRGFALMTMAECLIREANATEAIALLREALAVFEALPERWALLRAASLLAQACGALGDWARVAVLLGFIDTLSERISGRPYAHMQAALDTLDTRVGEHLGPALPPARQAGRVLGRGDQITAALWPAADRKREPAAASGLPLTRREREIAELIAHGLTNRQIAARLFIAERTVDTHVGRILAKLGCAGRAQVAAIVTSGAAAAASEPGRTIAILQGRTHQPGPLPAAGQPSQN
jgi:predicted ATPase/DNA-binding CsgD family transcriptional regulator